MTPGHVFATRGDVTNVACDAWLLPTDIAREIEAPWRHAVPLPLPPLPAGWGRARRAQATAFRDDNRGGIPVLTDVGGAPETPVEWYLEGVGDFVREATSSLRDRAPKHRRERHLLAMPFVGTGEGGAALVKGTMAVDLVRTCERLAVEQSVDLCLVLRNEDAFTAVQAVRRRQMRDAGDDWLPSIGLTPALREEATRLAHLATSGQLVLFLGAGVSAGAGVPLWSGLLEALARRAGVTPDDLKRLDSLHALDRARIIEGRLKSGGEDIGRAVVDVIGEPVPALLHLLLASLPVAEAATTNYDRLFELACEHVQRPTAVLPYDAVGLNRRWLLKMHGSTAHPEDIVLTREDYLGYSERRAALTGIVQALLVTRHMLFVGFSLDDDNFHRIVHDVRKAIGRREREPDARFGTALTLGTHTFLHELWDRDLTIVAIAEEPLDVPARARQLEIFIDTVLLMSSVQAATHLMDPAFDGLLTNDDRALREGIQRFLDELPPEARQSEAWRGLGEALRALGGSSQSRGSSPSPRRRRRYASRSTGVSTRRR